MFVPALTSQGRWRVTLGGDRRRHRGPRKARPVRLVFRRAKAGQAARAVARLAVAERAQEELAGRRGSSWEG